MIVYLSKFVYVSDNSIRNKLRHVFYGLCTLIYSLVLKNFVFNYFQLLVYFDKLRKNNFFIYLFSINYFEKRLNFLKNLSF